MAWYTIEIHARFSKNTSPSKSKFIITSSTTSIHKKTVGQINAKFAHISMCGQNSVRVILISTQILVSIAFTIIVTIPWWSTRCNNCSNLTPASLMFSYYQGLWEVCISIAARSNTDCSKLQLPGGFSYNVNMQLIRAFAILATVFSVIPAVLGIVSLPFVPVKQKIKSKLLFASGFLEILAGTFEIIAVSWYASRIGMRYYRQMDMSYNYGSVAIMPFTYGACLYLGWIFGSIAVITGAALVCSTCAEASGDLDEFAEQEINQMEKPYLAYANGVPNTVYSPGVGFVKNGVNYVPNGVSYAPANSVVFSPRNSVAKQYL